MAFDRRLVPVIFEDVVLGMFLVPDPTNKGAYVVSLERNFDGSPREVRGPPRLFPGAASASWSRSSRDRRA